MIFPRDIPTSFLESAIMVTNNSGKDVPMATTEEKRVAVKQLYFDPKGPSTILPICDSLREKFANISRGNVRNILRSLETYQRNFARRRPPKIMGRMSMLKPGIIAVDMFFPTKKIAGWQHGWNCLTCMDCWSRFCHVYVTESKKRRLSESALMISSKNWLDSVGCRGEFSQIEVRIWPPQNKQ